MMSRFWSFSPFRKLRGGAVLLLAIMCFPVTSHSQPPIAPDNPRIFIDPRGPQPSEIERPGISRIDGILSGYRLDPSTSGVITYSFYSDSVFAGAYGGSETGVREVSEPIKASVRVIMGHLSEIINVDFVEVVESSSQIGQIRILFSDGPNYAYAYYPTSNSSTFISSDIHLNPNYDHSNDTNGFRMPPGYHGYMSLIHEKDKNHPSAQARSPLTVGSNHLPNRPDSAISRSLLGYDVVTLGSIGSIASSLCIAGSLDREARFLASNKAQEYSLDLTVPLLVMGASTPNTHMSDHVDTFALPHRSLMTHIFT